MSKAPGNLSAWLTAALVALVGIAGCGDSAEQTASPGDPVTTSSTVSPNPPTDPATQANSSAPRPAQGVFGSITGEDGQPVPGAMVQPAPGTGNSAPEREVFATSAADGTYGIELPPGEWDLTISADGYQPAVQHVSVPPDGTVQADFELAPAD